MVCYFSVSSQQNSWATTHSAISFFTDYQWNWRQIVLILVNGNWLWRISRLVRFLAILKAAEFLRRHEVWRPLTSMILTENRKCDCPSINGHKNCVKSPGASSRTFLAQLRPSYFQPPYALRQGPPLFFKKYCFAGKITVYKGRKITSVMSRKLRKRDKKKNSRMHGCPTPRVSLGHV